MCSYKHCKVCKIAGSEWEITGDVFASDLFKKEYAISSEDLSTMPEQTWGKQITNSCKLSSSFHTCTHANKHMLYELCTHGFLTHFC